MFSTPETAVHVLDKNREISPLERERGILRGKGSVHVSESALQRCILSLSVDLLFCLSFLFISYCVCISVLNLQNYKCNMNNLIYVLTTLLHLSSLNSKGGLHERSVNHLVS